MGRTVHPKVLAQLGHKEREESVWRRPITGWALAGTLLGLAGFIVFPIFLSPAGFVLGAVAIGNGDTKGGIAAMIASLASGIMMVVVAGFVLSH